jgi:Mn-containing catalase
VKSQPAFGAAVATAWPRCALTYFTQLFHTEDRGIRDMLQNIATEEVGNLKMVALMIEQHTKRAKQGTKRRPSAAPCLRCVATARA